MSEFATNFVPLAPVRLVRPNGAVRSFGLGASNNSARGVALSAAIAAAIAGDSVQYGPGTFEIATALTPPAGSAMRPVGNATITSDLATPAIILSNDNVLLDGVVMEYTLHGAGIRSGSTDSVSGVVLRNCRFESAESEATALGFLSADGGLSTEYHVELTAIDCKFVGGSTTGYGVGLNVDSTSRVDLINCDSFGGADAFLALGNAAAELRIVGGNWESPTDGITAGSSTVVNVFYARVRGNGNGDVYEDGGTVNAFFSDVRVDWSETANLFPTTAGLALLDDANAADQRATLGVNVRVVEMQVFAPTAAVQTGDGKAYFHVPAALNGGVITAVHAAVITAGTTGTTDVQIARIRSGSPVDVLSTKLTIDSGELGSDTAATAAVINAANDDLQTNDRLRIDLDAVSSTPPQGLIVTIQVTL